MLKWTVHKTAGGGGGSPSKSVGPCCSIRRAAAKLSRHRPRSLHNKENQCQLDTQNESPRRRDSIYMCLDTLPVALRDVSNLPRTPEALSKVPREFSNSQPRPSSSCSPHRKEVFRESNNGLKRCRSDNRPRQTPTHLHRKDGGRFQKDDNSGYESTSPARKKQPCTNMDHQTVRTAFEQTFSTISEKSSTGSPQIEYSPCPLRATQSLVALRQRMTDTFPLISQGISLDNPLYFALNQSPTPSPVDLFNKEIPTDKKKRDSLETPTNARDFVSKFVKNLSLGLNLSDETKLTPQPTTGIRADLNSSFWISKNKPKTCEVSPLARKLAWLRLNNGDKGDCQGEKVPEFHEGNIETGVYQYIRENKNIRDCPTNDSEFRTHQIKSLREFDPFNQPKPYFESKQDWNSSIRRFGNVVCNSSVIHILNTNHDRNQCEQNLGNCKLENNLVDDRNLINTEYNSSNGQTKHELTTALKRRGVIFNENTFALNTPPTSDSDERRTKTSSCCTSIDLDEPSTLKRQRVIRRRRLRSVSDANLPLSKRLAKRHPISYLTLPKGVPSPFDKNVDNSLRETPKNIKSKSTPHLGQTSSRKVTFGSLYDIEYSDSGDNSPSFLGLTLPKGIPSPPSPDEEEIPGVRPLESPKLGNKRKSEMVTNSSDCSEETWDSHGLHYLKTPRLADNVLDDASFVESARLKSPSSSKAQDEEDNDDDFSSLASSTVTNSPLRQYRSRRCLSFTSPIKRVRPWKRIIGRGELEVSLHCFGNLLIVNVYRGRNLGRPGAEPCNAYVKVCLIPSGGDRNFHRTCVRKYSNNPRFDHKFVLELQDRDWERRVLISAWHRDRGRRRSEFLGCMSFAVKQVSKKEISGSFRLLSQGCGRTQHVPATSSSADHTDAMANQSESSVEECVSIEESDTAPTPDPAQDRRSNTNPKKDLEKTTNEDSIFLKHLELDPPPVEGANQSKGSVQWSGSSCKGGRTPFTTTKRLTRQSGTSFGFSIAWTHPPRIERVESGLPADQAGLRPGDYVIFVDKTNVVTLPEEDILKLIKSCGNNLTLEIYRKVSANGTIGRSSLLSTVGLPQAPARSSTACSGATTTATATASIELTKRRLHLPQVTFTSEVGSGIIV